jgi:hypothetical protein
MGTKVKISLFSIFLLSYSILYAQVDLDILFNLDIGAPPSGLNTNRVGNEVSILGDINGDGFDDWATTGGVDYEIGTGYKSVHIFLGSAERRESETPADIVINSNESRRLGLGTWQLGDVNADGFDDIVIGGSWYNAESEEYSTAYGLFYGASNFDTEVDVLLKKLDLHPGIASNPAAAGDVNNDGYDDILLNIVTSISSQDTAHVYVYFGAESIETNPDLVISGTIDADSGENNFSNATGIGDVNNDGFADIMVSSYSGGMLYFGGIAMDSEMDMLFNDFHGAGIGNGPSIGPAGDVNNDGYADILLTANVGIGKAFVCFGSADLDSIPDLVVPMWEEGGTAGFSASVAGDLNNDGFDDILLGTSTSWPIETGQVKVFYGGTIMDNTADVTITTPQAGSAFGYRLTGNGDFDGDGIPDILVGDPGILSTTDSYDEAGSISIFYGAETISSLADAVFSGVAASEGFGYSVAYAGDVNNDGYPEILVGAANHWDAPYHYAGRAYLFYGGETAFDDFFEIFNTTFEYNGNHAFFGKNVQGAGDINGDGYSDIFIEETNKALIFLGGELPMDIEADYSFNTSMYSGSFAALGDVNQDGFDDVLFADPVTGTSGAASLYLGSENLQDGVDVSFTGTVDGDALGSNISAAGDLNGDGYPDLIISISGDDSNGTNSGAVNVYFGAENLSNIPDLVLQGHEIDQYFGYDGLTAGGDLNNDGYTDIAVSDKSFSLGADSNEGRIYIYYGGNPMDSEVDFVLTGTRPDMRLGERLKMIPDLNNDGFDELLTNDGYWLAGGETTIVYYGGETIDTTPDIELPYTSTHNDCGSYVDHTNRLATIFFGDPTNDAAGPDMGRVIVYGALHTDLIEKEIDSQSPASFVLEQNYPNPFNPTTLICYSLSTDLKVNLSVYNINGNEVATLVAEKQAAGQYRIIWDAGKYASGLYFYRLSTEMQTEVRKMLLVR